MSIKSTKQLQKERAEKLHRQIEQIKGGDLSQPISPNNPRDFIVERMREIQEEKEEKNEEPKKNQF